jgi:hypothetical protein
MVDARPPSVRARARRPAAALTLGLALAAACGQGAPDPSSTGGPPNLAATTQSTPPEGYLPARLVRPPTQSLEGIQAPLPIPPPNPLTTVLPTQNPGGVEGDRPQRIVTGLAQPDYGVQGATR